MVWAEVLGLSLPLELAWAEFPPLLSRFHNQSILRLGMKLFDSTKLASVLGIVIPCPLMFTSVLGLVNVSRRLSQHFHLFKFDRDGDRDD